MFASSRLCRIIAAAMASLVMSNLFLVNVAHATDLEHFLETSNRGSYIVRNLSAPAGFLQPGEMARTRRGPGAPAASHFFPKAAEGSDEAPPKKKGLWGRIKNFMADDWRQTKDDMRKVGKWLKKPLTNFKIGWRRTREKLRGFRVRLFRGTKLMALSLLGKELSKEQEQVHLLLTAYIDQHGVETLLETLENSDNSQLEQLALAGRKVDDPVLRAQLLQRYVAREYLRMQKNIKDKDPEQVALLMEKAEEQAAAMEISDPDPELWQKPNEAAAAPVYTPYFPFVDKRMGAQNQVLGPNGKKKKGISLQKVLIAVIGGVGLVLAGYFAFTTMTIAPFLAFISTLVSLLGSLRNMSFGQQVIVVQAPPGHHGGGQQPFQGPWPTAIPTEEPPPLQAPPEDFNPAPIPTVPPGSVSPDPMPDPLVLTNDMRVKELVPSPEAMAAGKINLNTANLTQLQELPGIGPAMAKRIIATRKKAPFKSANDLLHVVGFGKKKLKALAPYAKL